MNNAAFFATVRARLDPLSVSQVEGFGLVLGAIEGAPLSHRAYMLATAWHETNKTMQPVREAYWKNEAWRRANLRYYPWYGRGLVQLTWEPNYAIADVEASDAGLITRGALLENPDLAMRPDIAAFVMRHGMDEGWFTGKRLSSYLPARGVATRSQYIPARRIINILDKADLVEDYAQIFERALRDGGVS